MNCVERSLNSRADLISLVLSLTCLRFPALHGWYEVMEMRWKRCSVLAGRPVRASATAGENAGFSKAKTALRVFREAGCASEKDDLAMGSAAAGR